MAYSKEEIEKTFAEICNKIAKKGTPLRTVLKEKGMPSSQTFYKWIDSDKIKSKQYARSCEDRSERIFEEILQIANNPELGETTKVDNMGKSETTTGDMIQHRRLQIDARKWMLSKMFPKKYGDKIDHTSDGKEMTTTTVINLGDGKKPK
jgi:hypothetical protein